jgi:hypothetical protein
MSFTETQTLELGQVKQLVDINKDYTNFKCIFRIVSSNKVPFDMIIVPQSSLDNNENLEFKNISDGEITGEIIMDKNIYDNWFFVLQSSQQCQIQVQFTLEPLPVNHEVSQIVHESQENYTVNSLVSQYGHIFALVILIAILLFYVYTNLDKLKINFIKTASNKPSLLNQMKQIHLSE